MKKIFNVNYKTLMLVPFVSLMAGCAKHTNVIEDKDDEAKIWLVRDTKTNQGRFFNYSAVEQANPGTDFKAFRPGDTIELKTGLLHNDNRFYKQTLVIDSRYFDMKYDKDALFHRQDSIRWSKTIMSLRERVHANKQKTQR